MENTINQLSLCELYPDSELYTYSNWYEINQGMIDVYWADKDYSYIANIPVELLHTDSESVTWSSVDFIKDPSWINLGFLAWDVAAVFVPFVPGSYIAKGGKKLIRVASKADDLKTAKYLTVGPYYKVKKLFKGANEKSYRGSV